tara:strand:+ start:5724 stop:6254 length:531 start_codon:yes stop_codon:yes gene_type:complete
MECPICYDYINISCIPSCSHHFCYACIKKWCCKKEDPQCPICKISIRELKFDKEFDQLNKIILQNDKNYIQTYQELPSEYNNYLDIFQKNKKIYIDFNKSNKNIAIGVTVKNNIGPGVKIIKVNNNNMAFYSGFEVNDIILYINNIECTNHKHCINILQNLKLCNKVACCVLLVDI